MRFIRHLVKVILSLGFLVGAVIGCVKLLILATDSWGTWVVPTLVVSLIVIGVTHATYD